MAAVPVITIDSAEDDRLAGYRAVSDPALARAGGRFVAEGRRVVERLLLSPAFAVESVLVTKPAHVALQSAPEVLTARPNLPVYLVPQDVMNRVAGFHIHRGCLALARRPVPSAWETLAAGARLMIVLEQLGDADNVGSTFRCAAAFGVDAVLLGTGCADPLYRKAIRTSMGAALAVPFAIVDETTRPWPGALHVLRAGGWDVVGLTPRATCPPLWDVAGDGSSRLALVFGHEGDGLSPQALDACTRLARIPMVPGVDSLNVAVSVGVALHDVTRTRQQSTLAGKASR
jgi:tRNA G18 (ribose-2'-O)-methylase SpoU